MTGLAGWGRRAERGIAIAGNLSDLQRGAARAMTGSRGLSRIGHRARWDDLERRRLRQSPESPAVASGASWGERPQDGRAVIAVLAGVWTLAKLILYAGLAIGGAVTVRRGLRDLRAHLREPT